MIGVAKAGVEKCADRIDSSYIVAPSGETVTQRTTKRDDPARTRCDLDLSESFKATTFNCDVCGRLGVYQRIVERKGQRLMADGTPVSQPDM